MERFNLYVHGVPIGHEICGCNEDLDYIKGFYNHDEKVEVSSLLQIDVVNGKSFYTYLRKKNVRNAEGRPGSYFGMTVSFSGRYCTNVQMLYEILDAIYRQICVNCIIKEETTGDRFLVRQISTSKYRNHPVVDYIKAAFQSNFESLRFDELKGFASSKSEVRFSLKEVDSPLFNETLRNRRILVSPEYEAASVAYGNLLKELKPVKDANAQLTSKNAQLTEKCESLSQEVAKLNSDLAGSAASASQKYNKQLDELRAKLKQCEKEREKLESKIKEATSAVDLIDEPLKKLTRLLAGRFQEKNEEVGQKLSEAHSANRPKHSKKRWLALVNPILLVCLLLLYWNGNRTVSQLSGSIDTIKMDLQAYREPARNEDIAGVGNVAASNMAEASVAYDKYKDCRIDISQYQDTMRAGTRHVLSVKKGMGPAIVPAGTWEAEGSVIIDEKTINGVIISGNIFTVNSGLPEPINVLIHYTVNGKHEITRRIIVK